MQGIEPMQGNTGNVGTWQWWGPMQWIETHTVKCSECRYMVVGIAPSVQKVTHGGNWTPQGIETTLGTQGIPCVDPHHSHVPTFPVFPYVGSIACMGDLFTLRTLSPPPCTYIHCVGFNFLCGFLYSHVPTFTAFHCVVHCATACPSSHLCVILT